MSEPSETFVKRAVRNVEDLFDLWRKKRWLAVVIVVGCIVFAGLYVYEHFFSKPALIDKPLGRTGVKEIGYLEVPALVRFRIAYRYPEDVEASERDEISKAWSEIFLGRSVPFPSSIPRSDGGNGSLIVALDQKYPGESTITVVGRGYYTDSVLNPSGGPPARVTWGINLQGAEYKRSALTNGASISLKFTLEGAGLEKVFDGTVSLNESDWFAPSNNIQLRWKGRVHVATASVDNRQPLYSKGFRSR